MRVRTTDCAIGLGLWFAFSQATFAQPATNYSIASIEYLPAPLATVGSVKVGLICLPKGKLRWRDVARPSDRALIERVEATLRSGGLSVAPQPDPLFGDAPPVTKYRLRVAVERVDLHLCVAGEVMLIGKVGRKPTTRVGSLRCAGKHSTGWRGTALAMSVLSFRSMTAMPMRAPLAASSATPLKQAPCAMPPNA